MRSPPLHDKPIVYGSALANGLFFALVLLHIVPAVIAPISAIVALGWVPLLALGAYFVRRYRLRAQARPLLVP